MIKSPFLIELSGMPSCRQSVLIKKFCLGRIQENYHRLEAASSMDEVLRVQGSNSVLREILSALNEIPIDERTT